MSDEDFGLERLQAEFRACGVQFSRIDSESRVAGVPSEKLVLANLLIAAKGKELSSPECLAVRNALGAASLEWTAYQTVRQEPVRQQRREQFMNEAINLLADLFDGCEEEDKGNGKKGTIFDGAKLKAFKDKIQEINGGNPLAAVAMKK